MKTFKNLTENVQEAITMPYGTDFNRPANPEEGMVRYNTTQEILTQQKHDSDYDKYKFFNKKY